MRSFYQINRLAKKDLSSHPVIAKTGFTTTKSLLAIIGLVILISGLAFYYFFLSAQSPETPTNKTLQKTIPQILSLNLLPKGENREMNILILGRPGPGYPGENLTDTIILAHFNPTKEKLILISLPRDLLVKIPKSQNYTKINQLYGLGGLEMLKQKTEEITGLSIDSYVLTDLAAVKEIVDLVDGLNILIPQNISDPFFPGPNYTYEAFALSSGWRYLDGETALKYIRTRYTSPNGDFDRMARQQQILKALKQKTFSLNPFWDLPTYLKILRSLSKHIQTDLSFIEIQSLWQRIQKIESSRLVSSTIDKEKTNLLVGGPIALDNQLASVVWPKTEKEDYSEIKKFIKKNID